MRRYHGLTTPCLLEGVHGWTHVRKCHVEVREKVVEEPLFRELEVIEGGLDELDPVGFIKRLETKLVLHQTDRTEGAHSDPKASQRMEINVEHFYGNKR